MNEGCGLKSVVGAFATEVTVSQAPELCISQRHQLIDSLLIAFLNIPKELSQRSGIGHHRF
jgi:hypothetical protein